MWEAVKRYFQRPGWVRVWHAAELLVQDLVLGLLAMVCIKLFSDVSAWLGMDSKQVYGTVTFGDLFRVSGVNVVVVIFFTLKHLIHGLR